MKPASLYTLFAAGFCMASLHAQNQPKPTPSTPPARPGPSAPGTPSAPDSPGTGPSVPKRLPPASDDANAGAKAPTTEAEFLTMTGSATAADMKVAKLAATHSRNPAIVAYAQRWLQAQQTGAGSMTALNKSFNVTVPENPDADAQRTYERLNALRGAEFDRAFLQEMQRSNALGISRYEAASRFAKDKNLSNHINQTLPTLRTGSQELQRLTAPGTQPGTNPRPGGQTNLQRPVNVRIRTR